MSTPSSRKYDSTVARMAGNIAGSLINPALDQFPSSTDAVIYVSQLSVLIARAIIAEVKRTEPTEETV